MKKSDLLQHIADLYRSIEALEARVTALENPVATADDDGGDSGGGTGEE